MTVVELLDEVPINNIIGALTFKPEKIIYIGGIPHKKFEEGFMNTLKRYLPRKGLGDTEIEYVQVIKDDLKDILKKLDDIYTKNADCKFNIEVTGGDDLILIGIGILCHKYSNLNMFQVSSKLRNIRYYSLDNIDSNDKEAVSFRNSVEDNLVLHGAAILKAECSDSLGGNGWNFTSDFVRKINVIWKLACKGLPEAADCGIPYPIIWNKVTSSLAYLDSIKKDFGSVFTLTVSKEDYEKYAVVGKDAGIFEAYIKYMEEEGFLNVTERGDNVVVKFADEQIKMCLTKSGDVLELKTYLLCRELLHNYDGDVRQGVHIDWDGIIPDEDWDYELNPNTANEVDVLATCGISPYFISCKNGKFGPDELYKLDHLAYRFGTNYSKKIIVTTDIRYNFGDHEEKIIQRAKEMDVILISDIQELSDEEFKAALSEAFELPKLTRKKTGGSHVKV